ncbi:MFS transporter, DHA1 family, bicyclomycin/chloramphenicol resistance protein [Cribrihabitans marinus]|uniref:MFS-type drug efflux transporter P55 n=1 Tax=Cribrihabitans marinus TaxID=1227549 RepID=A0A1H6VS93_9RHOB|nr:multidrug effflux MFS transporter [Cribrihabitans marinus]GGH25229.1 MFS transporter [Cribrihabitans marinus]SEJ07511.1 MFS transporter, DHA1 family, bicyclomycin/chloramphenicol resistance protein [Cribrihabitans marinus]
MANRMSKAEFIALIGVMFATIAFSIDAMLPALPEIGTELSPATVNRAQLVLTSFVLGMGLGTLFTGPLSDAFGRKAVIQAGLALYVLGAGLAWAASSLELVLAARVLQGIGAAAPRIVGVAIMRDLYSGREMARILSIAMLVFTLFPALAPAIGAGIIAISNWRGIFAAFVIFALVVALWLGLRLAEPLPEDRRLPFRARPLWAALKETLRHPTVRLSIVVQTLCLGMLFTMLTMVQPVYDVVYDRAESFPFWFGAVAILAGTASLLNAAVVVRVGMRRLVTWALGVQILLSGFMLLSAGQAVLPAPGFGLFVAWQTSLFFMAGMTLGNLNAIAMEPMGHVAGMAASVIGAISTVGAACIAAPVGLLFDGSLVPLAGGITALSACAFALMLHMGRVEARLPV